MHTAIFCCVMFYQVCRRRQRIYSLYIKKCVARNRSEIEKNLSGKILHFFKGNCTVIIKCNGMNIIFYMVCIIQFLRFISTYNSSGAENNYIKKIIVDRK